MVLLSEEISFHVTKPSALSASERNAWAYFVAQDERLDSAFYGVGFALACEAACGGVRVVVARNRDGEPLGFLPFQRPGGFKGVLGFAERAGGTMADYSGAILKVPGSIALSAFCAAAGVGLMEISHCPARSADENEDLIADEGSPVTRLENGFEAWWEGYLETSKSRASDLGRRRRKLERECGEISFVLDGPRTQEAIDRIIDQKCDQYRRRGATDVFENVANRALLYALARQDDPHCQLVVSELYAGDVLAASHIGLRSSKTLHYWFPVFNEDIKRMSPGRILILEILRAAPEAGMTLVDYGLGESRTKMEFATSVRPFVKGQWVAKGPKGAGAQIFQSLLWRLKA